MRIRSSKLPLIILVLIVIMIVLTIIINRIENKPEDYSGMTDEELATAVQAKVDSMELHALGAMEERDRIEYYLGQFIDALEKSKYEKAYNMLNENFRKNYFPTLEDFTTYAKTKFPMMFSIEHTNIERNGNTYILWVNVANSLSGKDTAVEYNFVIRENDLNKYELSFSVK